MTVTLGEMGERRIVRELIAPRFRGVASFGDDCAPFGEDRVITTDSCTTAVMEKMQDDPYYTGWLLATINLSDLAAAGAEPEGLVVNYMLRTDTSVTTLNRIMDGVEDCAARHGTRVLGGDITDGPQMHLSATAVGRCGWRETAQGRVSTRLSRRGAAAGDRLLLVGSPGYLWAATLLQVALQHVGPQEIPAADRTYVQLRAGRPTAQLAAGRALAEAGLARAAIDVSDGLFGSVRSLCEANDLGACLHGEIELDAVVTRIATAARVSTFELGQTWGDWSLLVAVRPEDAERARAVLAGVDTGVRDVGALTADAGVLELAGRAWAGVDQERFSRTSWHGAGLEAAVAAMQERSRRTV